MTEPQPSAGPHLFVGGQCHGMRLPETCDFATFKTTKIPPGGGPATLIVERYKRLIFRIDHTPDLIVYAVEPMNHDDVLLWSITGIHP